MFRNAAGFVSRSVSTRLISLILSFVLIIPVFLRCRRKAGEKAGDGQPELWLVYGVNGELVAEYDAVIPGGTLKKEYGYRGGQILIAYDAVLAGDEQLKWVVSGASC